MGSYSVFIILWDLPRATPRIRICALPDSGAKRSPLARYRPNCQRTQPVAWQYNDPEHAAGGGDEESYLRLRDLVPEATYEITSLEQPGNTARATGRELMTGDLRGVQRDKLAAAVVLYRRAK